MAVKFEMKRKSKLLDFLMEQALALLPGIFDDEHPDYEVPFIHYVESTSPDAIDGEKWLENHEPYIHKIGVLALVDSNKAVWAYAFIGHWREPDHPLEFVGHLRWRDGENDDIARSIERYVKCLEMCRPNLFKVDRYWEED